MYRKLNPEKTIDTICVLNNRIHERFPNTGLNNVCGELIKIAKESKERVVWFSRPILSMRIIIGLIIISILLVLIYSANYIKLTSETFSLGELIQILEAGINDIILIGAALFFLFTFETRVKRGRALTALYELRAIAHVIDMHQLTKDPSKVLMKRVVTPSSPELSLNAYELSRYLDYSSEMLSLVGKIAALYAENLKDGVVLSAVNEIENLTTGLSRKIWQKLMILEKLHNEIK
jgi:hypothetical protein